MPKIKSAKTGRYTKDSDKDTTITESVKKKPDVKKAAAEFLAEEFEPFDITSEEATIEGRRLPDLLARFGKYLLKQK